MIRWREDIKLPAAGLTIVVGLVLFAGPAFASHATCLVNGGFTITLGSVAGASGAQDVNTACNNQDLRARGGVAGATGTSLTSSEPGAPGFDPSQLLAFAALDRCVGGNLRGSTNLESGSTFNQAAPGQDTKSSCQNNGGNLVHGPFSALGPGAVTGNMFGRVITFGGFADVTSFLKADDGNAIFNGTSDPLLAQGLIIPCTNPLRSEGTGFFTCDIGMLGSGPNPTAAAGVSGVRFLNDDGTLSALTSVNLASFNMRANTSGPFTARTGVRVSITGTSDLGSGFDFVADNDFQFLMSTGSALSVTGATPCNEVVTLAQNTGTPAGSGTGNAGNLDSITRDVTSGAQVSCGVQRVSETITGATGMEDPVSPGTGNSLVSMTFSWFVQQFRGGLTSVAAQMVNSTPRINWTQLVSQGGFNMDTRGFFLYNQQDVFPVASYPTGRSLSSTVVVVIGPERGDPTACLPADRSPLISQGGGGPCNPQ